MLNVMLSRHVKIASIEKAVSFIQATYFIEDKNLIEETLQKCKDESVTINLTERLTVSSFTSKNEICFKMDRGTERGIVICLPASLF